MSDMDEEVILEFVQESSEHLDGIEDDLLAIEEAGAEIDDDIVNKVFRAIHTVKGGAGFLGLETIKNLAHIQEHVLNLIRKKTLVPTSEIVNTLLQGVDQLRELIENHQTSNDVDVANLITRLEACAGGDGASSSPPPEPAPAATGESTSTEAPSAGTDKAPTVLLHMHPDGFPLVELAPAQFDGEREKGHYLYLIEVDVAKAGEKSFLDVVEEFQNLGDLLQVCDWDTKELATNLETDPQHNFSLVLSTVLEPDMASSMIDPAFTKATFLSPELLETGTGAMPLSPADTPEPPSAVVEPAVAPIPAQSTPTPPAPPTSAKPEAGTNTAAKTPMKKAAESSIRVNLKTLNNLMSFAGELVLARNQLVQTVRNQDYGQLESLSRQVDQITSNLQLAIMSTRMQPIGNVFNKFKRVVRDLAQGLGKGIHLEITGEDVELDKTIIESIGDPLTHLVRNSCDHGIELPSEREAAGKTAEGTLKLTARHEAGQVIIEIIDDGKGIDHERIKQKALGNDYYDPKVIEAMTPKELVKLIFDPGFSLADQVTDISGRGVGMDVVNSNFNKLGGVVDIDTEIGKGTTMRIKLPLTLAIMPTLLLNVNEQNYAVPQSNLVELVRISPDKVAERIQKVGEATILRLRQDLMPLLRLSDVLGIEGTFLDPKTGERQPDRRDNIHDRRGDDMTADEVEQRTGEDRRTAPESSLNIMVVSAGDMEYGLIVDDFLDSEETVVKPLGQHLKEVPFYAGATIQGDGRVAMILDVAGIASNKQLKAVTETEAMAARRKAESEVGTDAQTLLVFKNAETEQFCVPLSLIARIEKIEKSAIEMTAGRKSIQYRGGSLGLFEIAEVASVAPRTDKDVVFILVFSVSNQEVGLMVSDIVDVVQHEGEIDDTTFRQAGIMGSTILEEETTLMVDLYEIIQTLCPDWGGNVQADGVSKRSANEKPQILVVDDSSFYRNQIKRFIVDAGCDVVTADDGVDALAKLKEEAQQFDLVVTDIEMPNMDGLQLTRSIKQDPALKALPVIAVTSLAGNDNESAGYASGVDKYLVKLNKDQMINTLNEYIN